ncbi:SDR family oxidoreductase [Nostoc sp. NMS8]|uniref:SDR family oxidoreductase n=1 Tax=Nostoc sp. NMS8 TaxID=2815392 RepID=UPI0025CD6352|nr:SDR family oxidoreductase [Nostoc sp. NMS8]MBN3957679.1 SDR family oxidoreductase [Nostoc sp. NMS8]
MLIQNLQSSPTNSDLTSVLTNVQRVFAEVTRYPLEILEAQASLEEDLGIDSVKLGEVFSVLREHYKLPSLTQLNISQQQLLTISDVAVAISQFVVPALSESASTPNHLLEPISSPTTSDLTSVLTNVQRVFAEVTRYPLEILEAQASLEEDLGIDSVKLGEVFSVLREHYKLPSLTQLNISQQQLLTISDVAVAISQFVVPASPSSNDFPVKVELSLPQLNGNGKTAQSPLSVVNEQVKSLTSSPYHENNKPLAHKIALITGSGRGLGKVIAHHLAELGATVIVNSFHSTAMGEETAAEIIANGGKAIHIWGSVANETQLHQLFDKIEAEFGKLDFFISNASNGMLAPLEEIKVEHLEKAFHTNVIGLHQGALRAAKLMKKQGGGKIITLSTNAAHRYIPYFGCMATIKAAVEALTRYLAMEFEPYNIQVNCISSGPVYGELINKWPESEKLIPYWESISLGNKLCMPEDVADMVSYLLREEVKRINGSILLIDAGQSIHM